jgi:glycosyltransferase involved in cell wall biosynthesis
MAYYNRPQIVKNALESIKSQNYDNWELAFVDDGSSIPGKEIVEDILKDSLHKVKFFNTNHTRRDKELNGGSMFGSYWNEAMYNSDADIAIMLCDDDTLYPDSLKQLNEYYKQNKDVVYSYGHVSIFDPYATKDFYSLTHSDVNTNWFLNKTKSIHPVNNVDASQVSWRINNVIKDKLTFPAVRTANLDAVLYEQLYNTYGYCVFNGILVQYKGVHSDQLGQRLNRPYETKEMNDRTI